MGVKKIQCIPTRPCNSASSVGLEVVVNLYAYIMCQLRYIKHHHAPISGLKEVQLHGDWQEL